MNEHPSQSKAGKTWQDRVRNDPAVRASFEKARTEGVIRGHRKRKEALAIIEWLRQNRPDVLKEVPLAGAQDARD